MSEYSKQQQLNRIKQTQLLKHEQEEWRKTRIKLIQQKKYENFNSRKITKDFSQAIQNQRAKFNMTIEDLSLKLMITTDELQSYENGTKCPSSQTVVKLRKLFNNLPKKYFYY